MFFTISYFSSLSDKTAGFEHSMQSPSHISAFIEIHSGVHPFISFVQLHYFILSKYDCCEAVLAQCPLKMSKPVGRTRGGKVYIIHPHWLTHMHAHTHTFSLEFKYSDWYAFGDDCCFFICFYEFQKNRNKRG